MAKTGAQLPRNFYTELPCLQNFNEGVLPENLSVLPDDWIFFVTDIMDSSSMIASGRYKSVHLSSVAALTAALNAIGREEIPYLVCGDVMQLACPGTYERSVFRALHGVARRVRRLQGFQMRVAGFRAGVLRENGCEVRVGKLPLSPDADQAVFWGSGLDAINLWIREGEWTLERPDELAEPDLSGLECRWQEVPCKSEEVVNLLVQAWPGHPDTPAVYGKVLDWVEECFGSSLERHPLQPELLSLHMDPEGQRAEVDFRHYTEPGLVRSVRRHVNALAVRIGSGFMQKRQKILGVDWGKYFDQVVLHSDCQKFSGTLALMASGTSEARQELQRRLEEALDARELVYGIHVGFSSVITCMVLERDGRHFHFVDGAAGGNARAAADLKRRLEALEL